MPQASSMCCTVLSVFQHQEPGTFTGSLFSSVIGSVVLVSAEGAVHLQLRAGRAADPVEPTVYVEEDTTYRL